MKRFILIVFILVFVTVQQFAQTQAAPPAQRTGPGGDRIRAMGDSGQALLNAARNNAEVADLLRAATQKGIAPVTR